MKLAVFTLFVIFTVVLGINEGEVDGVLGYGRKWVDSTVQHIGDADKMDENQFIEDCCSKCLQWHHATEMVRFINGINYCKCFKSKPGKSPKTVSDGGFIGTCHGVTVNSALGANMEWNPRSLTRLTWGHRENHIPSSSASQCCLKCSASYPTTQVYEFDDQNQKCKCFRIKAGSPPVSWEDALYEIDVCGSDLDRHMRIPEGCFENNQDYPGLDTNLGTHYQATDILYGQITDKTKTAEKCQILCQRKPECNSFTWSSTNQRCYLKSGKSGVNPEVGAISGPKRC